MAEDDEPTLAPEAAANGWVSITAAARALDLSRDSLAMHVRKGRLQTRRDGGHGPGGTRLVRLEEVRALLRGHPPRPRPEAAPSAGPAAAELVDPVPDSPPSILRDGESEEGADGPAPAPEGAPRDELLGACSAFVDHLVAGVLGRVDEVLAERAEDLERQVVRRRRAAEELEAELARAAAARQVAEREATRLRLAREALDGRRAEFTRALNAGGRA